MRLRNQLVVAAEDFLAEENLSPVLLPTIFKVTNEQHKPTHKVFDFVERQYRKICVTLLRFNVDKQESLYTRVRIFAGNKEDENFQQIVNVSYTLEEFIYLLDVMKTVR